MYLIPNGILDMLCHKCFNGCNRVPELLRREYLKHNSLTPEYTQPYTEVDFYFSWAVLTYDKYTQLCFQEILFHSPFV
jgi:hypothetical protein